MEAARGIRRGRDAALAFLVHLRVPFQLVLAPIWLLGALTSGRSPDGSWVLPFLAVHIGLYGGATAYNSHYDRDEGPIAFLKRPPPADRNVRDFALALQMASALYLATVHPVSGLVAIAMFVMGIAYSHPRWRWKARTFVGLLAVAVGQGAGAVVLGYYGSGARGAPPAATLLAGLAAALVTVGVYPVTQAYQVDEDRRRGDRTLAVRYGWKTALVFAAAVSTVGLWIFAWLLSGVLAPGWSWVPLIGPVPLVAALVLWARRFEKQSPERNHDWAMGISAGASAIFWLLLAAALASAAPGLRLPVSVSAASAARVPPSSAPVSAAAATSSGGGPSVHVEEAPDGLIRVEAAIGIPAPAESVWAVLTDYGSLASYMPAVDSSRVVDRDEDIVRVLQAGHARFVFRKSFEFLLEFRRIDPQRLHFRRVEGDFEELSGVWIVTPHGPEASRVEYRAAIRHSLVLPGFLVRHLLSEQSREMLPALRTEVLHRSRPRASPTGRPSGEPIGEPAERPGVEPADRPVGEPPEGPVEKPAGERTG